MQTKHQIAANPKTEPTDFAYKPEGYCCPHPHRHLLLVYSPKAATHFAIQGRVKILRQPTHCSKSGQPVPKAVTATVIINATNEGSM